MANRQTKEVKGKEKAWQRPTFPQEAVSSAQESLTSVFGMGTGITSPLWPPGIINNIQALSNDS